MRHILYFSLLFLLGSCLPHSDKWTKFFAKGLREVNEGFGRMIFIDDKTGFLFGDYTSDKAFENQKFLADIEATIYRTNDAGKSWTRTVVGKGKFQDAFIVEGVIYAVKDSFTENSYNNVIRKLYSSSDFGNTWTQKTNANFLINQIAINSTQRTAIIGDTLFTVTLGRDSLMAINAKTKKSLKIEMPEKFQPEIIKADKDKLWIVGYENKNLKFLERKKDGTFEKILFNKIERESPLIAEFNVVNNDISLIAGDEATIIGVTHRYYKSINKGKSWIVEEMPSSLYAKPIAFFGKDKVWTYCGTGSIQVRQ